MMEAGGVKGGSTGDIKEQRFTLQRRHTRSYGNLISFPSRCKDYERHLAKIMMQIWLDRIRILSSDDERFERAMQTKEINTKLAEFMCVAPLGKRLMLKFYHQTKKAIQEDTDMILKCHWQEKLKKLQPCESKIFNTLLRSIKQIFRVVAFPLYPLTIKGSEQKLKQMCCYHVLCETKTMMHRIQLQSLGGGKFDSTFAFNKMYQSKELVFFQIASLYFDRFQFRQEFDKTLKCSDERVKVLMQTMMESSATVCAIQGELDRVREEIREGKRTFSDFKEKLGLVPCKTVTTEKACRIVQAFVDRGEEEVKKEAIRLYHRNVYQELSFVTSEERELFYFFKEKVLECFVAKKWHQSMRVYYTDKKMWKMFDAHLLDESKVLYKRLKLVKPDWTIKDYFVYVKEKKPPQLEEALG